MSAASRPETKMLASRVSPAARLAGAISATAFQPRAVAEQLIALQGEKREVSEAFIAADAFLGSAKPDEAKAKAESKAPPEFARGSARSATVIGGIWIDIDVKNDQHAKGGLASELNMVIDAVLNLPIRPTCINTTGGGIHAWYAFKEPWVLESDEERARSQSLVEGFQRWTEKVVGFTVDMTFDLARVLRLPGTVNHKYTPRVTVTSSMPFSPAPRYNPSDFDDYAAKPRSVAKIEAPHPLVIDLDVKTPEKLTVILAHDVEFHGVWHRSHPERKFKSDSEYDMSLAARLVRYDGWTDQEICDVIIAHRRLHGGSVDRKDFRQEKIAFTIAKARRELEEKKLAAENDQIAKDMRIEQLDGILDQLESVRAQVQEAPITQEVVLSGGVVPAATIIPQQQPAQLEAQKLVASGFTLVNEGLGIPREKALLRLIRYEGDDGVYVLHTMAGQVKLGPIENLHFPDKFAMRLADGVQITGAGEPTTLNSFFLQAVLAERSWDSSDYGGGSPGGRGRRRCCPAGYGHLRNR